MQTEMRSNLILDPRLSLCITKVPNLSPELACYTVPYKSGPVYIIFVYSLCPISMLLNIISPCNVHFIWILRNIISLCYVTSYLHAMFIKSPCYVTSYLYAMLHHISMLCYIISLCYVTSYLYATLHHISILRNIACQCYVISYLWFSILRYITSQYYIISYLYATLYHISMLRYIISLSYVISHLNTTLLHISMLRYIISQCYVTSYLYSMLHHISMLCSSHLMLCSSYLNAMFQWRECGRTIELCVPREWPKSRLQSVWCWCRCADSILRRIPIAGWQRRERETASEEKEEKITARQSQKCRRSLQF